MAVTLWEYGYLYSLSSVYVVTDAEGDHVLEGVDKFLSAANILGRQGWILNESKYMELTRDHWLVKIAEERNVKVAWGWRGGVDLAAGYSYFMRRPVE
jgi:hypothetical protein